MMENHDILVDYILERLPADEMARIDGYFVAGVGEAEEAIAAAETELIRDYLVGALAPAARQAFEIKYGRVPALRRRVEAAALVAGAVLGNRQGSWLRRVCGWGRRVLLTLVVVGNWRQQVAFASAVAVIGFVVALRFHPVPNRTPDTGDQTRRGAPTATKGYTSPRLRLLPGADRNPSAPTPVLELPIGSKEFLLELALLAPSSATDWRATLQTRAGDFLWRGAARPAGLSTVVVTIPAAAVNSGEFVVQIDSGSAGELHESYSFGVGVR